MFLITEYKKHSLMHDKAFWSAACIGLLISIFLGYAGLVEASQTNKTVSEFIWFVFIFPVFEELIFRGALQSWLDHSFSKCVFFSYVSTSPTETRSRFTVGGITPANIFTSLLFSALHALSFESMLAASVFFPSMIYGWFRDRYKSIIPSIIMHSLYNLFFILFSS